MASHFATLGPGRLLPLLCTTPGLQSAVWSPRHVSCLAQGQNTVAGEKQVPRKGIRSQDQPKHCTGLRVNVPTSPLLCKSSSSCPHPISQQSAFWALCRFQHTHTHTKTNYRKSSCHRTFLSTSQSLILASVETNNGPTMVPRYPGV